MILRAIGTGPCSAPLGSASVNGIAFTPVCTGRLSPSRTKYRLGSPLRHSGACQVPRTIAATGLVSGCSSTPVIS